MTWQSENRFKIITIGSSNVGKTALLKRWTTNRFESNTLNTLGAEFMTKKVVVEGKELEIILWDTAGQEQYRAITKAFFRGSHGVVIAFSLVDRVTFTAIDEWYQILTQELGRPCPIIVTGNKCDLVNERVVKDEEAQEAASRLGANYFECSACTGEGVDDMFMSIVRLAIRAAQPEPQTEPLQEAGGGGKGCC